MTTGESDAKWTDVGVVTAWDAGDGIGVVTTDDAVHEVWFHVSARAGGLSAADVVVGLRVRVVFEPVEDQDGFQWRAVRVAPVDSLDGEDEPSSAEVAGEPFSRLEIGPFG